MLKKSALLLLCLIPCFYAGCAVNPITGEEELMFFPEEQDIEIGRQYSPEVEKQLGGKIPNNELQNYINSVGQKIARVSHRPYWEYHFVAVEHKSINAAALPGGYVFVTKGMLEKLTTEAQLAALLAHETAHITARHSSAAMSRQMVLPLVLMGLGAAGALPEQTPEGAMRAAELAWQIIGLKYSRKQEQQADLAGLDYMVRAGYNPYGAVEIMQMLEKEDKIRPSEFLSSHPSPENRLNYLNARIQTRYYGLTGLKIGKEDYQSNVLQHLIAVKANEP